MKGDSDRHQAGRRWVARCRADSFTTQVPWGGEHTIQHTDGVLWTYTLETYVILLTNVTPINPVKIKNKNKILKEHPKLLG